MAGARRRRASRSWSPSTGCSRSTRWTPRTPAPPTTCRRLFGGFAAAGIDYHKVDFVFAGAIEGRRHADVDGVTAYREGLRLIREAIGPAAYLLGCGAPQQASAGLVDAMRVGPDVNPAWEPYEGDWAQPGGRAARATTQARLWSDAWWVVDPDCLLARPWMEHRADWAAFVERVARRGGLVSLSDSIADLDAEGIGLVPRPPRARLRRDSVRSLT